MAEVIDEVVIPAAGLGSRMSEITKNKSSKLMLSIGDVPIISYAIDEALASGYSKIYVITNKLHEDLSYFLKKFYPMVNIIKIETTGGSAETILKAEKFISGEFFSVILPDIIIKSDIPPLSQMKNVWKNKKNILGVLHLTEEEKSFFGSCEFKKNQVKNFEDAFEIKEIKSKKDNDGDLYHARSILSNSFFNLTKELIKEKSEPDDSIVYKRMLLNEKFLGLEIKGKGFDCGNPEGYKMALKLFSN